MNYNEKLLKAKAAIQSKQLNGLVPRGAWAEKNIYMPQDIVYFKGKTYICITSTQGTDPKKSKDFVPFAGNGKDGIDARNIEVGKNNTHIRWRYIDSTKWYDLVNLDSLVGEKGDQGEMGKDGKRGIQGKAGDNGKQVQLRKTNDAIEWRYEGGTWISLVKISELIGPRGEKGEDGKSAYEIWLEQGNKGTKNDFLSSLRGASVMNRGGGGKVDSIVAGTNITVDNTDPRNPRISAAYDDATDTETDTGTSTTKYVSPAGLKTAKAGTKPVSVYAIEALTAITTGDGKAYFRIPTALNGMNLVMAGAAVVTTSSSGNPTVQIARGRQANATSAHTFADMLSTRITIDATEYDSKDATTAPVIDTANDDVLTGDLIRVDVDVAGTGTTGLIVTMSFQIP